MKIADIAISGFRSRNTDQGESYRQDDEIVKRANNVQPMFMSEG